MMNPGRFVLNDPVELFPERRHRRGFLRPGLGRRGERWLDPALALLLALFAGAWIFALAQPHAAAEAGSLTRRVTENPLSPTAEPPMAYLLEAAVRSYLRPEYRGESGALRVIVQQPGDTLARPDSAGNVALEYSPAGGDTARGEPVAGSGVWTVLLRAGRSVRRIPDFSLIRLVPLSEKRNGRIGGYLIGSWPYENGGKPRTPAYAPPAGLVRVTPENLDTRVSDHFRLRDFVTKGQQNVWPKYVAMSPRLLDKLELTIQELQATGTPVEHVGVISGFRTPSYNAGGGDPRGRGALSRHMYGDAMDWFVDNNRDGRMDDLNHDGRIDREDGRVIVRAAERVERKHPSLVGGIGLYSPTGAHAGFVHIDTRGFRARW